MQKLSPDYRFQAIAFSSSYFFADPNDSDSCEFYARIAALLYWQCDLRYVSIWSCSADSNLLVFVASSPKDLGTRGTWPASHPLCGTVIDEKDIVHFDLNSDLSAYAPREFSGQHVTELIHASHMVSIPVLNAANWHHVRFIINFFPSDASPVPDDDTLSELAEDICDAVDRYLDDQCLLATTDVQTTASQHRGLEGFLTAFGGHIKRILGCQGITVFLPNPGGEQLSVGFTSGIRWNADDGFQFYQRGEGLTGRAFVSKSPMITPCAKQEPRHKGKSFEVVSSSDDACLIVPILDAEGNVQILVRCRNKQVVDVVQCFTDDDVSLVQSMGAAAVPYVRIAMDRLHSRALTVMAHEFKAPVVAIRNLSQEFMRVLDKPTQCSLRDFARDLRDLDGWAEVMRRIVKNVEFLKTSAEPMRLSLTRVDLVKNVIEPLLPSLHLLMRSRRYAPEKIDYEDVNRLPTLRVDREWMEMVFFHLLLNAVKYGPALAADFRVHVAGTHIRSRIKLTVHDWGIGIPERYKEDVFKEGFRSPDVLSRDVTGQGVGLWIVRQVVESHGGRVYVSSLRKPTEMTIELPKADCDYREWRSRIVI